MKKIILLIGIAGAVCLFESFKGSSLPKSAKNSSAAAASARELRFDKAAGRPADTAFVKNAAAGGMAEVALSKLALGKTSDAMIKQFAGRMVTDHSKANDELAGIAKSKNITLPAAPDAEHQAKIDSLGKLSGSEFNKAYVMTMIADHKKTLELMQGEAAGGQDAELKAFAAKTAPVVKMHLDMISRIHDSMK